MNYNVIELINECKTHYCITNFKNEILNWKYNTNHPGNLHFNIGHPKGSHKGSSLGDMLPYTRLPEIIKKQYPTSRVSVPIGFKPVFEFNPHVDDYDWSPTRWGSLGTWGTSVQRTANVWGFQTFTYSPIIYNQTVKIKNSLLFCVNSKTGGQIKNLGLFEDIIEDLKTKYYCVQLGMTNDPIIRNANEHAFNIKNSNIVNFVSKFETYIGSQNSIYHLSKALGANVIGILPNNVYPQLVVLPLLTQINWLELEMLTDDERKRSTKWRNYINEIEGINPDESHHIGWLYPDCVHLTERNTGTKRCPSLSVDTINQALTNNIYPFNDEKLWNVDKYRSLWMED
ncbi:MAG: hypothetical protein DRI57_00245 [Deltaproteobacteria bacterium]|nr:MAG: hypothetical protein DRI57_00245 [Deltaproteobacteria bacterium]